MNKNSRCAIWGTPAIEINVNLDGRFVDSSRAGGKYFISGAAEAALGKRDDKTKARLTTWLVEQRRLGNPCPEINLDIIGKAEKWKDKRISDRADSILRYLAHRSEILGAQVYYRAFGGVYEAAQLNDFENTYFELLACSECTGEQDFVFLLSYLKQNGAIEITGVNNPEKACILTVGGYARLAELETTNAISSRAFVALWFDDSMQKAWECGFEPAIRAAGYEPVRIDQHEHVNKIDDEIIAEIRRARFVVADFTHGDEGVRGSVYYEAGFAYGLNVTVIFTCHQDSFDTIHFDTRQYNHIVWTEPEELRENLTNRIASVIGDGPIK